ncbi:AMP-binding protein [Lachnospiraceae bacterium 62-35]
MWNFSQFGTNTAAVSVGGEKLSYGELIDENRKLAAEIGGRCLVFLLCTNSIGALEGYTAFLNHGIVPLLIPADMDRELLENLIETYKPDYLWIPQDMRERFSEYSTKYAAYQYELVDTGYEKCYPLNDELCLLLTTSGSTGSPKLVRQSYKNVLANAEAIAEYLELDSTERPITTLPMNYTYGLSIINSHLLVGATLLLVNKGIMQKEFWTFFKEKEATSFGGVPYTYEMLDKLKFSRMDLPSLRTMTQAGGKLSPELHKKFAKYAIESGKRFFVMYGQAEATARMSYLPYEKSLEKYGSMGIAIPGGRFSVIDFDGKEIKTPDTAGELVYQGPNVTLGYAECGEDLSKGDERNGCLFTGDIAQFDKDGYYYIVGRKKRFLKIFGNRVNLDEIDQIVKDKFGNIECVSSGRDDQMFLFITEEAYKETIRKYLSEKTGLNSAAFIVKTLNQIPRNDSGKIQYKELEPYMTL